MTTGRKPKPTHLKLLEGEKNKDRINKSEPKPDLVMPEVPGHLNDEAKKEWHRITPTLHRLGLLTEIDGSALAVYCTAYARWIEAEEMVTEHGFIVKSPKGYPIQHPALAIANKAMEQMIKILAEFGMTPSSRTKISVKPGESEDPMERLLGGGR